MVKTYGRLVCGFCLALCLAACGGPYVTSSRVPPAPPAATPCKEVVVVGFFVTEPNNNITFVASGGRFEKRALVLTAALSRYPHDCQSTPDRTVAYRWNRAGETTTRQRDFEAIKVEDEDRIGSIELEVVAGIRRSKATITLSP